ncbi:MAG TPA: fumarylacetoacetate hydrolase family protein [Burkholderiaceae bacterium]|nr:fumarylacetoacetate hydrolase family protein [Burkholderiaceae bacterium]
MIDADRLARELLQAADAATLLPLPSDTDPAFDLAQACAVADRVRALRLARGEVPVGYKIGFTNRSIWPRYGVFAPMWAPVWQHTTTLLDGPSVRVSPAGLSQPRLEPEIVFGLKSVPRAGMDNAALVDCIEWVAHGFEIVHTHFADWKFGLADCFADHGLHGRLCVGPRVPIACFSDAAAELRALRVELLRDGAVIDRGDASVVLGGPVDALRQWVDAMHAQPQRWPIRAGDVVTTGTITDAWPLASGMRFETRLSDPRLQGLALECVPSI